MASGTPGFRSRQTPSELRINHFLTPFVQLFCAVDDLNHLLGGEIRVDLGEGLDQRAH